VTVAYIRRQLEHHRRVTFQAEFRRFLRKHGIEYDERYVWGDDSVVPSGLVELIVAPPSTEVLGYCQLSLWDRKH
jgi:hypothetical protein